ncbi:hypothetical protein M0R45_004854 [Rubus argutus]|uniref:Cyclic nucleotide-binding domain-containing protein n=1 Tax=Rubus argutus TaxID=59490 RepID=A0AAW1YKY7_RUBAR
MFSYRDSSLWIPSIPSSVFEVVRELSASQREKKKKTVTQRLPAILFSSRTVILTILCVIAVTVDPLFFYLPIIDENKKCIGMDTKLRNVALIFRSVTDIGFIMHSIHKIHEAVRKTRKDLLNLPKIQKKKPDGILNRDERSKFAKALARKLSWHSIVIDFFAVLPIPQVLIVAVKSSRYLDQRTISNFFLLAQYLPRIYRMRRSYIKLRPSVGMWIEGSFLFFLYLLAGHALGAFWYYFSIQQELSCWYGACKVHGTGGCHFYCDEQMTSRNTTFINSLDKFCPVDVPTNETAAFNFGIFIDSLKNGNTGSIHFAKKFFYSFWWGLRNLSNYGTNLETSTYVWENCFAILISSIGMLLFLYLIGKVQTFISMKTAKLEETKKWAKLKNYDVQMWMKRHCLDTNMRKDIEENIIQKWEHIQDVDIKNLYSILPAKSKQSLKHFLCMDLLRKVPKLKNLKHKALTLICGYLKPVVYQDNSFIFQRGEPLDRILFITEGMVWTYDASATSSTDSCTSHKGGFYGDDQLLSWATASDKNDHSCGNLPISNENVKCHGKLEGFVLMAKDLKTVVSNEHWVFRNSDVIEKAAVRSIQNAYLRFKDRQR